MAAKSLQELFVEELRDIYDGEKRIVKALPKMAKSAASAELQSAFETHLQETEGQIQRLEQVFQIVGERARGKKCDGIMGIIEEGNTHIQELDGPVLDAALTAGAQKVEHYEIATYGTLAYYAELLGLEDAKDLLGETLEEEKATDEKLNQIAKSDVNRRALSEGEMEEDENQGSYSTRRGAGATAMANDRSASRGSRSAGRSSSRRSSSSSGRGSSSSRGRSSGRSGGKKR